MLKLANWILPRPVLVAIALLLPKYNRPLDPLVLKKAIATTLPAGTSKDQVIRFLRSRPALFCNDLGLKVEARLLGEALDQVHSWDIEVAFDFDPEQRLLSYSMSECLKSY